MPKIRAQVSGNTGEREYDAGEVVDCDIEHAKRAVLRGAGDLLDEKGRKVPVIKAIKLLRIHDDDVRRIATSDVLKLAIEDKAEV